MIRFSILPISWLLVAVFLLQHATAVEVANGNDTLEMELDSNITVIKLNHGLKFEAHSEFDLPTNVTDLLTDSTGNPEGVRIEIRHFITLRNKKKLDPPGAPLTHRVRRSNENAAAAKKKTTTVATKKKKGTTKKGKVTTKKAKGTTKKAKGTTKKAKGTTKKAKGTTKKKAQSRKTTRAPPRTPRQKQPPSNPSPSEELAPMEGYQETDWKPYKKSPVTKRQFVMYDDDDEKTKRKEVKQKAPTDSK